jgi:hypothetical protein
MGELVQAGEYLRVSLTLHCKSEPDAVRVLEALSRLAAGFALEGLFAFLAMEKEADEG